MSIPNVHHHYLVTLRMERGLALYTLHHLKAVFDGGESEGGERVPIEPLRSLTVKEGRKEAMLSVCLSGEGTGNLNIDNSPNRQNLRPEVGYLV